MRGLVAVPLGRVSAIIRPVDWSAARIWSTVAFGAACFSTAHVPATCGVAMEVPVAEMKPPPVVDERINVPGASRETNEAMFEYESMTSDFVVAPTLTAVEMHPGAATAFVAPLLPAPLLPAAITEAIPTDRKLSMIGFVGSLSHGDVDRYPPRLRLADERFRVVRTAYTRSRPAMMSEVYARAQGAGADLSQPLGW